MKTIKIFLASSEELIDDRNAFGNLVRRLDKIYEKRGIRIELFEWEDYDAAYNDRRKQDEYNEKVRVSDMFLALFHTKAGKFTIEEFDVATEEFQKHASPKVYTYCKDLQAGEVESQELKDFKKRLFQEMGHYWSRYNNRDSMLLHFVMQLQLVETSGIVDTLKMEEGIVFFEGLPIAKMNNLHFAANNEAYKRISAELTVLPEKIEKARLRVEKYSDEEDFRDDLQQKLDQYNGLQSEFVKLQHALFDTAKRIAQFHGERVNKRLVRAIEAFEQGDIRKANVILDEAEIDAQNNLADYIEQREITELKRTAVIDSIAELQFKCSITMADNRICVEERINTVLSIYGQLDGMAKEIDYELMKYVRLLFDYADFLRKYSFYDRAVEIYYRIEEMLEGQIDTKHVYYAYLNNDMGLALNELHHYKDALSCLEYAYEICTEVYGEVHPKTITALNNIAGVFLSQKKYEQAIEYLLRAISLCEKQGNSDRRILANSYNNIGHAYTNIMKYSTANEYFFKALEIYNRLMDDKDPEIAKIYNNIGITYLYQGESRLAKDYHRKAIQIATDKLGEWNPQLAIMYKNLGMDYNFDDDYELECEQYSKALEIIERNPQNAVEEKIDILALLEKAKANLNKKSNYKIR